MTKEINIFPIYGMCNRLRVLFSYLQICREQNLLLNVFWEKTDDCPGYFLDVFQPIEGVRFLNKKPTKVNYKGCSAKIILNKFHYKELKPIDSIYKEISKLSDNDYDAVHIRRTDFVKLAKKVGQYIDDSPFKDFIENSNNKVYLACDNFITQKIYIDKYQNKIFVNKFIKDSKNKRKTSLKDSVIDLFVCVKSKNFLGTPYSSYSGLIKCLRQNT
jgi:hypothetical protein